MDRTILHCDLNGFYASVECHLNPALQFIPMAVAGDPQNRHGIILAKNELAKQYRIQTAETIWQAKQKCPELILVPPQHEQYAKYSQLVNTLYEEFTDRVEPFGIDESWLDVSGVCHLFGSGTEIADQIRARVKERFGLTISVGVSFNKVFSKLGSDYQKPDATTLISRDNYQQIVWPLPVSDLLYVGKASAHTLETLQIRTIGDLAAADRRILSARLGKLGVLLHDYANGQDSSPVRPASEKREVKSIGNSMTFAHDLVHDSECKAGVLSLTNQVAFRLRRAGLKCGVLSIGIKDPKFKTITRQKTLALPSHLTKELASLAMELFHAAWPSGAPIRSLSINASQLTPAELSSEQLSLFEDSTGLDRNKQERLDKAVDQIRNKYGKKSIALGSFLEQNKP